MGTKRSQVQINYFRSNGEPFDWKMRLLEVEYKTKSYSRNIRPNKDMVMYYIDNKWPDYQFEEEEPNVTGVNLEMRQGKSLTEK